MSTYTVIFAYSTLSYHLKLYVLDTKHMLRYRPAPLTIGTYNIKCITTDNLLDVEDFLKGKTVKEAHQILNRAKCTRPRVCKLVDYYRAQLFLKEGQVMSARQALLEGLRWNPGHSPSHVQLAQLDKWLGPVLSLPREITATEPEFSLVHDALRPHTMLGPARLHSLWTACRDLIQHRCHNNSTHNSTGTKCGTTKCGTGTECDTEIKCGTGTECDTEIKCGTTKCGTTKCGTTKCGTTKCGTTKCGTTKCGTTKCGTTKCGTTKCGTTKCGTTKCGTTKCGTTKCGTTKCGTEIKCGTTKCGTTKCGTTKCGTTKCGTEIKCGTTKCGTTKCGTTKCDITAIECGVAGGGSGILVAVALDHYARVFSAGHLTFKVILCDTFEGMPPPSCADAIGNGPGLISAVDTNWATGTCSSPVQHITDLAKKFKVEDIVVIKQGLFKDTLPLLSKENTFQLAHFDADWYESILECFEHVSPSMNIGGIIQLDDYNYWNGCKKAVTEYFSRQCIEYPKVKSIDGNAVMWVKT